MTLWIFMTFLHFSTPQTILITYSKSRLPATRTAKNQHNKTECCCYGNSTKKH